MDDIYDSAGVDLTLIRSMLEMTPAQRLDELQEFVDFVTDVWKRNGIHPVSRDLAEAG